MTITRGKGREAETIVAAFGSATALSMDALSYPWGSYFPAARDWAMVSPAKPAPENASYVRVDAKLTALEELKNLACLKGIFIGRASQENLEFLRFFPGLACVGLIVGRFTNLAPLRELPRLEALELDDPPSLVGLDQLDGLRCLALRHFRRIKSLDPLVKLTGLRAISMSTIPSWDASRRCLEIESLQPLGTLKELESLALLGVKPLDGRLDPLYSLSALKYLHISHEFQFQLEDYAALARALPNVSGHCLVPYYAIPQLSLRCKRCGGELLFLTGPRPHARRQLCRICDAQKLAEHERQWNELARPH
jgi:hypothetical protein